MKKKITSININVELDKNKIHSTLIIIVQISYAIFSKKIR